MGSSAPAGRLWWSCPTYGWQIPHVLGNWLKKTRLSGSRKLYFVMTCGDGIGNAGGYAKRFCEKKGMEYMGCGKVVMPENYVAMFPVPDRTEAERIIGKAIPQADQIAEHIRKENPLPKAEISLLDRFLSTVVNPVFYKLFVHAGKFRTTERCTGCGACVRLCPLSNIRLEDGSLCGDQTVPTVWPASAGVRNRPSNTERPVWENPDTNVREPGREIGAAKKYIKNLQEPLASFEKVLYYIKDASVAQWIEQWPPEPCA